MTRLNQSQDTDTKNGIKIVETGQIQLNPEQIKAAKEWAADDRLWTTQDTVEFNLQTFARVILKHND
jgi:ribosomal 50S subunit-recycling heat shock protein